MSQQTLRDLSQLGEATKAPPVAAKDRPHYKDEKAMGVRLDRLVAFVCWYQKNHNGNTPTARVIANEMEATEEAVNYWLRRMEESGRVDIMARHPLRIMIKVTPKDLESARRLDNALKGARFGWDTSTARERFDIVDSKRIALAHFIGEVWQASGRGPSFKEMMDFSVTSNGALVQSMIDNLVERGIVIAPTAPRSIALTENGKMITGMVAEKAPPKKAETSGMARRIAAGRNNLSKRHERQISEGRQKIVEAGAFVLSFTRKHGHSPTWRQITDHLGLHLSNGKRIAAALEKAGRIKRLGRGLSMAVYDDSGKIITAGGTKEARVRDKRRDGRGDVIAAKVKRQGIYQWMIGFQQEHGRTPYLREIADRWSTGSKHAANVANIINRMVEEGLVSKDPVNSRLTILGAEKPLPVPEEEKTVTAQPTTIVRRPVIAPEDRQRWPLRLGALKLARFIKDYTAKWDEPPMYAEMKEGVPNVSISHAMAYMDTHGWLTRKPRHHRSAKLTEKGLALLAEHEGEKPEVAEAPEAVEERVAAATMPEIRMPTPLETAEMVERTVAEHPLFQQPRPDSQPREAFYSDPQVKTPLTEYSDSELGFELMLRGFTVRRA